MFTYTPTKHDDFEEHARQLLEQKTSMLEDRILSFWRVYEPKKLNEYFLHGIVRRSLKQQAGALLAAQRTMEELEQLPPALAESEAWRNLMRIEEDEEEEDPADREADWGPWRQEYLDLLEQQG